MRTRNLSLRRSVDRRHLHRRLTFCETLEPRRMLTASVFQPDLPQVFADFEGTIDQEGGSHTIPVTISPGDFSLFTDSLLIGWRVTAANGSSVDPAAIQIFDSSGSVISPEIALDNTSGSNDSVVIANLLPGSYSITVSAESGSGGFGVSAFFPGDTDGDRWVSSRDLLRMLDRLTLPEATGNESLSPNLDTDGDGQITPGDIYLAVGNIRNRTFLEQWKVEFDVGADISVGDHNGATNTSSLRLQEGNASALHIRLDVDGDGHVDQVLAANEIEDGANFVFETRLVNSHSDLVFDLVDSFGRTASAALVASYSSVSHRLTANTPHENGNIQGTLLDSTSISLEFAEAPDNENRIGSYTVIMTSTDEFGASKEVTFTIDVVLRPEVAAVAPQNGEQLVRLNRALHVEFDNPIDPTTVTSEAFYAMVAGKKVTGDLRIGNDQRSITLYPDTLLPASTTGQLFVNGNLIQDIDGAPVDADGNGLVGGIGRFEFSTIGLTRLADTGVWGYIYDSTRSVDGSKIPIVGVTLRAEGMPELTAVTDENGYFFMENTPGTEFFVEFDMSTVTSAPAGYKYLAPVKPFHPEPGKIVQLSKAPGMTFDIYFPLVKEDQAIPLNAGNATEVQFGPLALDHLTQIAPNVPRAMWEKLKVEVPADSLYFDDGTPASEIQIFGLDPEKIPAPLPLGVETTMVFSLDAGGAHDLGNPAKLTYPNIDNHSPGTVLPIWTFDHDGGEWKITGQAIVSSDGSLLETGEGGVTTLGWKVVGKTPVSQAAAEKPDRCEFATVKTLLNAASIATKEMSKMFRITKLLNAGISLRNDIREIKGIISELDRLWDENKLTAGRVAADMVRITSKKSSAMDLFSFITETNPIDKTAAAIKAAIKTLEEGVVDQALALPDDCLSFGQRFALTIVDETLEFAHTALSNLEELSKSIRDVPFTAICIAIDELVDFLDTNYPNSSASLALLEGEDVFPRDQAFRDALINVSSTATTFDDSFSSDFDPVESSAADLLPSADQVISQVFAPLLYALDGLGQSYWKVTAGEQVFRGSISSLWALNIPPLADYSGVTLDIYSVDVGAIYSTTFDRLRSGEFPPYSSYVITSDLADKSDLDGDGLADVAEAIIGTATNLRDTDNDGILDGAEIDQGLNPLDGIGYPAGIVGNTAISGEANDIVVASRIDTPSEQFAYLATGSFGIAVVNVSQFTAPSLLGELDLPGTAVGVAVNRELEIAYVASGAGGLHYVDVSNPFQPVLIRTIREFGDVAQVELVDGSVAVAGKSLALLDPLTGDVFESIRFPSQLGNFTDVFQSGETLFAISGNQRLHAIALEGANQELDSVDIPIPPSRRVVPDDMRLFVADGVAYVANGLEVEFVADSRPLERGGYVTFDVSDPRNMSLISNIDTGNFQAGNLQTVLNGSALAIVAGGFRGLQVHDGSDPANTFDLITEYATPGIAEAVAVVGGIAFVADGAAGLQVINYRDFDSLGVAPTISIDSDSIDIDEQKPGIQIVEGSLLRITPYVTDDVQVRSVELLVNGEVEQFDISFPFDLAARLPLLSRGEDTVSIEVRATDTGGNSITSAPIVVELVADNTSPEIVSVHPSDGSRRFEGMQAARVRFNESIDPATFNATSVQLVSVDNPNSPLPLSVFQFWRAGREITFYFDPLDVGQFEIHLDGTIITDLAGNPLSNDTIVTSFETIEQRDAGDTIATAIDLGVLPEGELTISDQIGIDGQGGNDLGDVFRFELDKNGVIEFDFAGLDARLRAQVYVDLDGDQTLDSNERLEEWIVDPNDRLNESFGIGVYYLRIYPYTSAIGTPYTLTLFSSVLQGPELGADVGDELTTARDLGTLSQTHVSARDVVQTGDVDVYQFTIDQASDVAIDWSGLSEYASIYLLQDRDSDGVFDSHEDLVDGDANSMLTMLEPLEAGTYFIWINPYYNSNNGDNTAYELDLSATKIVGAADAGDNMADALDLGTLSSVATQSIDVVQSGDVDVYQFTIDQASNVQVDWSGLSEYADLYLLHDLDSDGVFDSGDDLASDYTNSMLGISEPLEAGTYFIWIQPYSFGNSNDNTAYTLSLSAEVIPDTSDAGDTLATATVLGVLSNTPRIMKDVVQSGDVDVYRFTIDSASQVNVEMSGLTEYASIDLMTDLDTDGVFDSFEELEVGYSNSMISLSEPLESGTYYLWIQSYSTGNNNDNTAYTLTVSAEDLANASDGGDALSTATELGLLTSTPTIIHDVIQTGDLDVYEFSLDKTSYVNAEWSGLTEYAYIYIVQDSNADFGFDSNEDLARYYANSSINFEEALEPGEYFVWVEPYSTGNSNDNTAYTLTLSAETIPGALDAGDTLGTANDLGILSGTPVSSVNVVQTGDVDVYQFMIDTNANVDIELFGLTDQVRLYLVDDKNSNGVPESGEYLVSQFVNTTFSLVESLDAGTYFVWIEPWSNASSADNSAFTLELSRSQNLLAEHDGVITTDSVSVLSIEQAQGMLSAAWSVWGVDETMLRSNTPITLRIDSLPGDVLARTRGNTIWLDDDAAGHGWFVDTTPGRNEEFALVGRVWSAIESSAAVRYDLLTVLAHELGHLFGQSHPLGSIDSIMNSRLGTGQRVLPSDDEIDLLFASEDW